MMFVANSRPVLVLASLVIKIDNTWSPRPSQDPLALADLTDVSVASTYSPRVRDIMLARVSVFSRDHAR